LELCSRVSYCSHSRISGESYKEDLLVFKVSADYKAEGNEGKWFFVDADYKAKKKIFFVDADYKAKWNKSDKKHLMY